MATRDPMQLDKWVIKKIMYGSVVKILGLAYSLRFEIKFNEDREIVPHVKGSLSTLETDVKMSV